MGVVRFHGKAVRLNGITDGLTVPTGRFKESGIDLRHPSFSTQVKSPKSDATKIGRRHENSPSNPLNSIRGAFTIDAFIVPDYGGVVVEKPGLFRLAYGNPFAAGPLVFDIHTTQHAIRLETSFNMPIITQANSGSYSDSSHKPQELTLGEQGLVMITAQFSQQFVRCYVNGDIVGEINLGEKEVILDEVSSDLFIGGQGGEYRGLIESVRISRGIIDPLIQPLTKQNSTLGLWSFDDDIQTPEVYFFDNARSAVDYQGRDGPDTHDGLMPIPMVAVGYDFQSSGTPRAYFKVRDYPANPGSVTDRYTALEKLAALVTGIELEDVKNQSWSAGSLDLTSTDYLSNVGSCTLNAIINHSATHPLTGIASSPSSIAVRYDTNAGVGTDSAVDYNPMSNQTERVRITSLDFGNSRVYCTSVHLANDAANNGIDNLPETQNMLFSHADDTLVWFTLGNADLLFDPGNPDTDAGVSNQRTRAKDTFTRALFLQGQRFSDKTEFGNDAVFVSPMSRIRTSGYSASVLFPVTSEGYSGMGGITSYSIVEGEFFLKMLPFPINQRVKQTIQGIANAFTYETDDISIESLVNLNDPVKVMEPAYVGGATRTINKATTVATTISGDHVNRIVVESGVGGYKNASSYNLSASTRDEIIAIAVNDVRPFLLKSLDYTHAAELSGTTPTNDSYIRHLTPEKKTRTAVIASPPTLISAGGPSKVLVHYDAIDLTGEVVAGTSLASNGVNAKFAADHATGNTAYLVVRSTVPCGSAIFTGRTLSSHLRRPYASSPSDSDDILLTVTAPGGLVSLPTGSFSGPMHSHQLTSAPTGDITPSPFINIDDCVLKVGTDIKGYGRPKAIASPNTPDASTNSDYHSFFVMAKGGRNLKSHSNTLIRPSSLSRTNLLGFDVIDNELFGNENILLVHPSNRSRHAGLNDLVTSSHSPKNPANVYVELNRMRGRIEEITPHTTDDAASKITIRGRSLLMDVLDARSKRNFNLSEGTPVKEIGDLGTPTVTLTLGGLGQGGIDIQPIRTEHPFLPGWKDKIVGTGNASVRNDRQASTYYASTRSLTEIPLFPSMFFDVDKRLLDSDDERSPLPTDRNMELTIDCTMTAMNRTQMREYESRYAVDWGMKDPVAAIEVTDRYDEILNGLFLIQCQRPSVQGIVTGRSTNVITIDDDAAFLKDEGERGTAGDLNNTSFWVTIGEGVLNSGYGIMAEANRTGTNQLTLTTAKMWNPLDDGSNAGVASITVGMTVVLGGYIPINAPNNNLKVAIKSGGNLRTKSAVLADLKTSIGACFGISSPDNRIVIDPDNASRLLIKDGPNMEAFVFDVNERYEANNDRPQRQPIECSTAYLALKGKKSSGTTLDYVRPQILNLSTIALKVGDFTTAVDEVIRRINMASHPKAKNSNGGSAFDPPSLFPLTASDIDTGTHMGYVRAFRGTEVESKTGERGYSIVIHSTVPGASGRNFCVWFKNRSPYPYRPIKAVGYGGLLATNSRLYQANSFAAPLPLGPDGETFVPITTFTGAPSGPVMVPGTSTPRAYDGIGGEITTSTVASPTAQAANGVVASGQVMTYPTFTAFYGPSPFNYIGHIAVSLDAADHLFRGSRNVNSSGKGILSMNGRLATFQALEQTSFAGDLGTNCFYLRNVIPYDDIEGFFDDLHDRSSNNAPIDGIKIRIHEPVNDGDGILFFGGGHTGITIDISDGTANDYSDEYPHYYTKGPTGFSGFQNLHEISTASAVIDFTDLTNEDTINDNTLQGKHHKTMTDSNGIVKDECLFYLRMNDNLSGLSGPLSQDNSTLKEELYDSPLRVTTVSGTLPTPISGPASVDATSKGIEMGYGDAIATYRWTGSAISQEYGPLSGFNPSISDFTISAWVKAKQNGGSWASTDFFRGPIICGQGAYGKKWGLYVSGYGGSTTDKQLISFAGVADTDFAMLIDPRIHVGSSDHSTWEVRKDGWTHLVFSHSTTNGVKLYIGNTIGMNIGRAGPTTNMVALESHYQLTGNAASHTNAAIPSAMGTSVANNMAFIGLSNIRNPKAAGGDYQWPHLPANWSISELVLSDTNLTNPFNLPAVSVTGGSATHALEYGTHNSSGDDGYGNAGPIYFHGGIISEVAIFNKELSASEVSDLYASRTVW